MNSSLTRSMYTILVITVLAVAAGVYCIVYALFYSAVVDDIRERANCVKDYILDTLTVRDFEEIGNGGEAGALARLRVQQTLSRLYGIGKLKHLYLAREGASGELVTTMDVLYPETDDAAYVPSGKPAADLRQSLREGVAVMGSGIYRTPYGSIYTIYWPALDKNHVPLGTVCMEFDIDSIYRSYRRTAAYSLILSGALIVLCFIIAYLSVNKVTQPFYKKLAYTDFLTGCENRMAFEQRMQECESLVNKGKSVTLFIFDLNDLKTINDTMGHKQGDLYLKNTVNAISRIFDGAGRIYRIGGDEFASILVGKTEQELQALMNALHAEKTPVLKDYPFNCACGAATFTKGVDKSLRSVFTRADAAMYTDKRRQKGPDGQQPHAFAEIPHGAVLP